ncbi:MAG: discoidin domain-containing protein [Solirubrobacterales bacterium]
MVHKKMTTWNFAVVLMAAIALLATGRNSVKADFTFATPVDLDTVMPGLADSVVECFSFDGLEMFICSWRSGGSGGTDIWVLKRASAEDAWGPPENLGPVVNSTGTDAGTCISSDGLELYFNSDRSGGYGSYDLYVTKRATRTNPWGPPTNLGSAVNGAGLEGFPWVSSDGFELYFLSGRAGYGGFDLYASTRANLNDAWSTAVNLGPTVNSPSNEASPCLSSDGLLLFFQDAGASRPGGYGGSDLWMTRRAGLSDPWGPPMNLGPEVNTSMNEMRPCIPPDGSALYFTTESANWRASIVPIMDFNGDGKVDAADMAMLEANWGQNTPLCDIGPFPWGDGIVDGKDLKVLMESLITPDDKASDVPCNIVLSWTGPSLADSYDIYFGTSFDDVSNATREDPCGVLVSEGQAETTYNPQGLLEFSKTYYWRVDVIDVVAGSLEPVIYKGLVFSFTTEDFAYPIQNITVTASNSSAGMGPEKTVDGSGLDENDGHSTDGKQMWLSGAGQPHWIQYAFDRVYTLHELWVWNSNQAVEAFMGFGAKTVKVEYSTDGATWTTLEGVPEFARAPGQAGYLHNTIVSFGEVSAKYVRLTIEKGWGVMPNVGLSEVRFFYIPDRSAYNP